MTWLRAHPVTTAGQWVVIRWIGGQDGPDDEYLTIDADVYGPYSRDDADRIALQIMARSAGNATVAALHPSWSPNPGN